MYYYIIIVDQILFRIPRRRVNIQNMIIYYHFIFNNNITAATTGENHNVDVFTILTRAWKLDELVQEREILVACFIRRRRTNDSLVRKATEKGETTKGAKLCVRRARNRILTSCSWEEGEWILPTRSLRRRDRSIKIRR